MQEQLQQLHAMTQQLASSLDQVVSGVASLHSLSSSSPGMASRLAGEPRARHLQSAQQRPDTGGPPPPAGSPADDGSARRHLTAAGGSADGPLPTQSGAPPEPGLGFGRPAANPVADAAPALPRGPRPSLLHSMSLPAVMPAAPPLAPVRTAVQAGSPLPKSGTFRAALRAARERAALDRAGTRASQRGWEDHYQYAKRSRSVSARRADRYNDDAW